jgi:hypothetical protein
LALANLSRLQPTAPLLLGLAALGAAKKRAARYKYAHVRAGQLPHRDRSVPRLAATRDPYDPLRR